MNQANAYDNQFFPLESDGNFEIFLKFLEHIVGHPFNEVKFVTAEDHESL